MIWFNSKVSKQSNNCAQKKKIFQKTKHIIGNNLLQVRGEKLNYSFKKMDQYLSSGLLETIFTLK